MTEENWVKLPDPRPSMLPQDTLIRLCAWCKGTLHWAVTDALVSEDNLGLVRYRGRAASNGEPDKTFVVASENISRVKLPPGYRFEGSEVVKEETVATPASLAGAFGLEKYANEAYAQAIPGQWQYGIQYGDCPRPECARKSWNPMRDRCDHCGVTGKEIAAKRAKPACKCGATENVRHVAWGQHRCGHCEQSRRRAELQAQKLEQTKRDMSRPVKRDPYEWLGFSGPTYEE